LPLLFRLPTEPAWLLLELVWFAASRARLHPLQLRRAVVPRALCEPF